MEEMRLDEYTEDEWYSVCKRLKPELSREDFEMMWERFHDYKQQKKMQ